jgi:hypothetical protein
MACSAARVSKNVSCIIVTECDFPARTQCVELLPLVENIDWDCRSDCNHTSEFEVCSTIISDDCIFESESEGEADASELDIGLELESNCDWRDDRMGLESVDKAIFPARCMCVQDLRAILEDHFPERTSCLGQLPLMGNTDWEFRSDCSDDPEE